ncbi:CubicO group peptidase, beta-lactamase class C family [Paenibacillus sp. UNCCL117]|uniref:cysteine-rich CWC family protein n=1 Tax=unclassified Paenibacillus TaxID=185978 RepID=UPI00088EF374|nr:MULTISPECIES: cysteine-rich CWC family protein [unclassified Paenibacillus]SDC90790.1 CubicO group peptidase, beta-lactamase class C family [Paenibacillus sp. cl123]SFW28937.1 CubicO group peptidase, beta-lactamase class C family [Paenibacillus sp. UNCCL117]
MSEPKQETERKADASRCPLCGQANECALLSGERIEACWCFRASIPSELLQRIPDSRRGKSCVCPSCVEEHKRQESVAAEQSANAADRFIQLWNHVESVRQAIGASAAAVIVMQDGRIAYERYAGTHPDGRPTDARSRFNVGSVRKSYLGLVVAWALHDGLLGSVDDPLIRYMPLPYDADILQDTTIRHLLTHTHGLDRQGRAFASGSSWAYNNQGVNLLIELTGRLYRKPFVHILKERLFGPGGFTATGWETEKSEELIGLDESYPDREGRSANLFVNARELALWGMLHAEGGVFRGLPLVPADVVRLATAAATPAGLDDAWPRNGFFWQVQTSQPCERAELGDKLPAGSFRILGITGCAVLVIPEQRTVAVRMYNQTIPNPTGYSYLEDIRAFGNLVYTASAVTRS